MNLNDRDAAGPAGQKAGPRQAPAGPDMEIGDSAPTGRRTGHGTAPWQIMQRIWAPGPGDSESDRNQARHL
jgi:hypothetical protein